MIHLTISQMNRLMFSVILISIVVLIWATVKTYNHVPPIPDALVTSEGESIFTSTDIRAGQAVFQKYNLMGFGTLLGNGSYFGPDFTAEYLALLRDFIAEERAQQEFGQPFSALNPNTQEQVMADVRIIFNSTKDQGNQIVFSEWAAAHQYILEIYRQRFVSG